MIALLTILLLAAHLWCMNLASASPLLATWLNSRQDPPTKDRDSESELTEPLADNSVQIGPQLSHRVAVDSMIAFVVGMLLGLLLGVTQVASGDRSLWEILPRFSHKIYWAIWELAFFLVCMGIFVGLRRRRSRGARWTQGILATLAATNLLYHFPPLFAVMSRAAENPKLVSDNVTAAEFRSLMVQGHVASLSVHFALACFAVAGVELLVRCAKLRSRLTTEENGASSPHDPAYCRIGKTAAAIAFLSTAAQLLVGVWLLTQVDTLAQHDLTGGNLVATGIFAISVVATFGLLHLLAGIVFGEVELRSARLVRHILLAIIVLMTAVLGWV